MSAVITKAKNINNDINPKTIIKKTYNLSHSCIIYDNIISYVQVQILMSLYWWQKVIKYTLGIFSFDNISYNIVSEQF